ncbi:MAG TPA: hydrogenase maturation nickel metallochaperone HypA [Rugosimonospora sp.]|nr:hydrogenase maturation nickel metallochaperone HypA [Rugosimonospora sp.]
MHEYGLAEGILDAVQARAGGRRVRRVRVRAGARHGVDSESMAQAWQLVAAGTEAADAALDLVPVPIRLHCRECGHEADTADLLAVCPQCTSADVALAGGDELTLESIGY